MSDSSALFAIIDKTDYQALKPIAYSLPDDVSIKFVVLNEFMEASNDPRTSRLDPAGIEYPTIDASEYVRSRIFQALPAGMSLSRLAVTRFLTDNVSEKIGYRLDELLADTKPDLLVSAVDQPPFIRHLIKRSNGQGIQTVTVQHGTYERALDPRFLNSLPLRPNISNKVGTFEQLKRRIGFRYGVTDYCHPHLDAVFTMGEFFRDRISRLREGYPDVGNTDIRVTGSPEYDTRFEIYSPEIESVLFLSQHQLENKSKAWTWDTQRTLIELLESIGQRFPVTVRPHPKASSEKIQRMADHLSISRDRTLAEDVEEHDLVLTINSTAIFEAVLQGKPCGTVQLSDHRIKQEPFVHNHFIQVTGPDQKLEEEAATASRETQKEYLRQFCYTPEIDDENQNGSSTELITDLFEKMLAS